MNLPRVSPGVFKTNGIIYVIGGYMLDQDNQPSVLKSIERWRNSHWELLSVTIPFPLFNMGVIPVGNHVLIFGGCNHTAENPTELMFMFRLSNGQHNFLRNLDNRIRL